MSESWNVKIERERCGHRIYYSIYNRTPEDIDICDHPENKKKICIKECCPLLVTEEKKQDVPFKMRMVDLTDHELSKLLYNIDSNWAYDKQGRFCRFIANGKVVAIVEYNEKGTRKVNTFINSDCEKSYKEKMVLVLKDIFK